MAKFTVFGLQRSGTNFLEQLLRKNIAGANVLNAWRHDDGIWKHAYDIGSKPVNGRTAGHRGDPKKEGLIGTQIHSIYVHKHPYSWIQSICDKQVDIKKVYPHVMEPHQDSDFMLASLNIENLAKLYRDHTAYWLKMLDEKKIYHLKYEDLIESPEKTREYVTNIATYFNVKFINKDNIVIPKKVGQSNEFTEADRTKYTQFQITTLTWKHIVKINNILDRDHLNRQGYDLITTQEQYDKHRSKK